MDFDDDEIEAFVGRWTATLERQAGGDTAISAADARRERQELLDTVQRNPAARRLAANPLLLTMLAMMKRQGVALPERRVQLYHQAVETLISSWNRARSMGRQAPGASWTVATVAVRPRWRCGSTGKAREWGWCRSGRCASSWRRSTAGRARPSRRRRPRSSCATSRPRPACCWQGARVSTASST
ncbi:MAG: hypothetical protein R2844_08540 [Caldilineales bacterium]